LARGCHRLIRDGARLVESAAEIIETLVPAARMLGTELTARLQLDSDDAKARQAVGDGKAECSSSASAWCLDPDHRRLLDELGHEPATMDELVRRTGLSAAALSSMLLMLELEARVEGLPGNRYQQLPGSSMDG
jgi:DNA processing protein